jgi:hypothetical protein
MSRRWPMRISSPRRSPAVPGRQLLRRHGTQHRFGRLLAGFLLSERFVLAHGQRNMRERLLLPVWLVVGPAGSVSERLLLPGWCCSADRMSRCRVLPDSGHGQFLDLLFGIVLWSYRPQRRVGCVSERLLLPGWCCSADRVSRCRVLPDSGHGQFLDLLFGIVLWSYRPQRRVGCVRAEHILPGGRRARPDLYARFLLRGVRPQRAARPVHSRVFLPGWLGRPAPQRVPTRQLLPARQCDHYVVRGWRLLPSDRALGARPMRGRLVLFDHGPQRCQRSMHAGLLLPVGQLGGQTNRLCVRRLLPRGERRADRVSRGQPVPHCAACLLPALPDRPVLRRHRTHRRNKLLRAGRVCTQRRERVLSVPTRLVQREFRFSLRLYDLCSGLFVPQSDDIF